MRVNRRYQLGVSGLPRAIELLGEVFCIGISHSSQISEYTSLKTVEHALLSISASKVVATPGCGGSAVQPGSC